jgi:hypothetical protein
MAFTATDSTGEPRAFSIGPLKLQILTYSIASGDTSGTVTADALTTITDIVVPGISMSAAPSISGNVATLTIVDPVATRVGTILVLGK